MRKLRMTIVMVSVLLLASSQVWGQASLPPEVEQYGYADMVLFNGKIVSMDDGGLNTNVGTVYEAMAVKGTRILALGAAARIRTLANAKTKVVDLQGRLVIPGIIETHAHLFGGGEFGAALGLKTPDRGTNITVRAGKDLETTRMRIEDSIKEAVAKLPPGDWLMVGVRPNPEESVSSRMLRAWTVDLDMETRPRIDRIAPDNPVMVQSDTRANLNTKALEIISQYLPDYEAFINQSMGSQYPDAAALGLVGSQERTALTWSIFYRNYPTSLMAEMIRRQLEKTAAYGVTTFSTRVPHPGIMDAYMWLNRENQMPIRLAALYEVHRLANDPNVTRLFYKTTGNLTGLGNDWMWIHGVASERWDTSFPEMCLGPDVEAPPNIKRREVCPSPGSMWWDVLQNALESGWRLAGIHGEGSHAVRLFIQMIEMAMKNTGMTVEDVRKMRMTMEHAPAIGQLPDVMAGLAKYNIFISASPGYFSDSPEFLRDYGPKVEPFLMPLKTLLANGVRVVGQNTPRNVGRMWVRFMDRKVEGKGPYLPNEGLDRVTVIKMWTKWASEYVMKENDLGTLEVGKLADFVILDKDYFTIPQNDIPKIRPQMTVINGTIKHLDAAYATKLGMEPVGYQFPSDHMPWDEGEMGGG